MEMWLKKTAKKCSQLIVESVEGGNNGSKWWHYITRLNFVHFRQTIYSYWLRACSINLTVDISINFAIIFKNTQKALQFTFSIYSGIIGQFFKFIRIT